MAAKDQYHAQSLVDLERVLKEDKTVKLVRDGLSVGNMVYTHDSYG